MPANLTPAYLQAEEQFKQAISRDDKIQALEEMLRAIPKHKGTEKMQADIKRRLSRLRKEPAKDKALSSQRSAYQIRREGAGQVVLCGPPNGGKSLFLKLLTRAPAEVADFPFTTRLPQPGMMEFEDIQIQLVDTPPLAPETVEAEQLALLEQADLILVIFNVNDPALLDQTEWTLAQLKKRGIELSAAGGPKVLILGNQIDRPGGRENFKAWQELFEGEFQALPCSVLSDSDRKALSGMIFEELQIVRVYTKSPGKKMEEQPAPYILKKGSTVLEAAAAVHQDLARDFKFARVWGKTRFEGQRVERNYVLEDGDCVEIHT